jgi:2-haloacid dehalogenase
MESFGQVRALTFDLFGTVLDLEGSLVGPIQEFLGKKGSSVDGREFWRQWRTRQRLEQYQDSLLMMGHSGYLEVARRACLYVLRQNQVPFQYEEVDRFMQAWQNLSPFPDVGDGLRELQGRFKLVALSNGELWYLRHLVSERIHFDFQEVISVEAAGFFKPHPAVYRAAARMLKAEPYELMMVSANSFDVMGARACGYRGAWVDRYKVPFEETPYRPDIVAQDFGDLARQLGC